MKIGALLLAIIVFPALSYAQATKSSKLTGTIYDANGSVIVNAKVTAKDAKGKRFVAVSDDYGIYVLILPYNAGVIWNLAKYDLTVESPHFQPSEIRGFIFIPSQFGKMHLDFGMEVSMSSSHVIID